ncbi:hypothetical protein RB595_000006 [Gaeumannomyces hyphopodioides]
MTCPLCRELTHLLEKMDRHRAESNESGFRAQRLWGEMARLLPLGSGGDSFALRFQYQEPLFPTDPSGIEVDVGSSWPEDGFLLFADYDSPASKFISHRPPLWDTNSDSTFDSVRGWIRECDSNHHCLARNKSSSGSPKRLLDVGDASIFPSIRVVEIPHLEPGPKYVALSYCWGDPSKHAQLRTLKSNADQHRAGIDFLSLPKTIQDAVTVCRRLNVRHLWVDALCIIQDDDDDRNAEIAAMGQIYARADFTIAATCAAGCTDGFLGKQARPLFQAPVPGPGGDLAEARWCPLSNYREIDDEHLHQRGWTFQEAIMSSRLLIFSSWQPYWVCRDATWDGGGPSCEDYLLAVGLDKIMTSSELLPGAAGASDGDVVADDLAFRWATVVDNYSSRLLSVLDDKLLAIHSIKELYRGGKTYVVGMWLEDLAMELLWATEERHERTDGEVARLESVYDQGRITNYPSWSWLWFDGSISLRWVRKALESRARLKEAFASRMTVLRSPGTDMFGRIIPGESLRIRCPVKRVLVKFGYRPPPLELMDGRRRLQSCYDAGLWDAARGRYRVNMTEEDVRDEEIIGSAVIDYSFPCNRHDEPLTPAFAELDYEESHITAPRLLDCALIASTQASSWFLLKPDEKKAAAQASSHEIVYGVLIAEEAGSNRARMCRVGLFIGDTGKARFFRDAEEREFDFV